MDPFLVLLHSLSGSLSGNDLMELKFLCRERVSKRKLERVQSGLDLFSVLLEQNDLERRHTGLLRELLASLRRHDLIQRLDDFEAGTAAAAPPGEAGGQGAGNGWRGLASVHPPQAPTQMDSRARPLFSIVRAGSWEVVFLICSAEVEPKGVARATCPTPALITRRRPAVLSWKTQLTSGCG